MNIKIETTNIWLYIRYFYLYTIKNALVCLYFLSFKKREIINNDNKYSNVSVKKIINIAIVS